MTVETNQMRYGEAIVDILCNAHCNVQDDFSFYSLSGYSDDDEMNCFLDFNGSSLGKDIDITKESIYEYSIGFTYGSDIDNPICTFNVSCYPQDEGYYTFPETGAVKEGTLRVDLKGKTLTATLNAITVKGVVVQAKIEGELTEW